MVKTPAQFEKDLEILEIGLNAKKVASYYELRRRERERERAER